jgi:hypothetical protein
MTLSSIPITAQEADAPAAWKYFDILTAMRSELQATKCQPRRRRDLSQDIIAMDTTQ